MKIIDFRVRPPYKSIGDSYLFGPNAGDYALRFGEDIAESAKKESMNLLIKEMDELGVVKGVVPTRKLYGNDNHDLITLMEEYPGYFIGVPNIDPLEGQAALDEIDELVVNGPCSGIIIEPGIYGMGIGGSIQLDKCWHEDDPVAYPVYQKCQDHGIPVLITCSVLAYPYADANIPQYIDHVAADFPTLPIVVSHAAWPWVQSMCGIAVKRPNVYLSPDIYIVRTPGCRDYIDAANYMLQDQMLFGSAYPGMGMKNCIDYCMTCGLREEILPKLMYENAAKLFKLEN